ncbi:MAG: polyprenyl diphosphate synthase [Bacteroidales bacterium]|nr:polyprenyl diphosphate synthase [Bacteroidales bacterium]
MEKDSKIPAHVSIIMDGNGRWARERGQERVSGHKKGVESVRTCLEAAVEAGVKYLSLYAFSEENWDRPKTEVDFLMKLMFDSISAEMESLMKNGVRFRVLGNKARLNPVLQDAVAGMENMSRNNDRIELIVFLSYSGRWDIFQAAKKFAYQYLSQPDGMERLEKENDFAAFSQFLVTDGVPDPDLIIRTSGEKRLSNYLLWQGAYSELVFVDKNWPDFGKEDFFNALSEYSSRDRRYGKVK